MSKISTKINLKIEAEKIAIIIASFIVFIISPLVSADTIFYTPVGIGYSPVTTDISQNRITASTRTVVSSPSTINYNPSETQVSSTQNAVSQSQLNPSRSQLASVASSINYNPTTTRLPQIKKIVIAKQTASVANAVTPALPKTGGGGRAKLLGQIKK